MTGGQQDPTSGLVFPNDMTCSRSAHYTILTEHHLLDAISSTDFDNELHDLWVPISAISANDKGAVLCSFRYGLEDAGDEGLGVVWLLENLDLLPEARTIHNRLSGHESSTWWVEEVELWGFSPDLRAGLLAFERLELDFFDAHIDRRWRRR